ncbi:MAG: hypothetical protein ABI718_03765 [Acidobacteriota bacterium]
MNKQKRVRAIAGFGFLAVVVIVFFSVWPPRVPDEQASGAIGAVKKFQQPQIQQQDVILTDETARHEEAILYNDYLTDAQKLGSIRADLGSALQSRSDLQSRDLESVSRQLQMHASQLQSRYMTGMSASLAATSRLMSESELGSQKLAGMRAEIDSLSSAIRNRDQLSSADMMGMNTRLESVASKLESAHALDSGLQSADAELGAVARNLQSSSLSSRDMNEASSRLESVARQLGARSAFGDASLQSRMQYFSAMAVENRAVEEARSQLGSIASSHALASRDMANQVGSISSHLASRASDLESMAVHNLQSRLNAQSALASSFLHMKASLASIQQSRSNLGNVDNLQSALQSRYAEFQSRAAGSMQMQLAAVSQYLNSRDQLASRLSSRDQVDSRMQSRDQLDSKLQSRDQVGSRMQNRDQLGSKLQSRDQVDSKMQNRDQLGSRGQFQEVGSRDSLASFHTFLGNVRQALDNRSALGSVIQNRDQLGMQANKLQSRTEDLASRSN